MITLLIVFAVIIIIFTYYCRKYSMNACYRNAKTQKCVNEKFQKSENVKIQKSENDCMTQGSVEPQDVSKDALSDVKDGVNRLW